MDNAYLICNRCVMDTSANGIVFDEKGVCSFCSDHDDLLKKSTSLKNNLTKLVREIKEAGRGKRYDCIVGVSGGVDSSWVLVQAVMLGLRPLAVHMDNGWNSELAQNNISNLITKLGVDLYTHVIDWNEYKSLMQAFFDADVIDVELLYDNAMLAVNYRKAKKYGIKYILAGTNLATEGMIIPSNWSWFKYDLRNIKAIARIFSKIKIVTFPGIGTAGFIYHKYFKRIQWISFLDYFDFNKNNALDILKTSYGYKPYLYKHYESVFTRFYQGAILPKKFGVDKRRHHLSCLIVSGQMTRDEAILKLTDIPYGSERDFEDDKNYFLKKMKWNEEQLTAYFNRPEIPHDFYPTEKPVWIFFKKIYFKIKRYT